MGKAWSNCDAGMYSVKGVNPLTGHEGFYCEPCPLGSYCIGGENEKPISCPSGWQGLRAGQSTQEAACKGCLDGYACPEGTAIAHPCGPGTYAPAGSGECSVCAQGWYCPGGEGSQRICPAGYISLSTGKSHCDACAAGFACSHDPNFPLLAMSQCEEGQYQDEMGQTDCKTCPDGHFCAAGAITGAYCPAGKYAYGENNNDTGYKPCVDCPGGYTCALGQGQPASCDKGTYSPSGEIVCFECPTGHFCPEATENPVPCTDPSKCAETGQKKDKKLI